MATKVNRQTLDALKEARNKIHCRLQFHGKTLAECAAPANLPDPEAKATALMMAESAIRRSEAAQCLYEIDFMLAMYNLLEVEP